MTVRSATELNDRLSDALAWRKKELSVLHLKVRTATRQHEQAALRRAALTLLYAHWEGFTREAASSYLELVARQRLAYQDLQPCFVALACRKTISEAASSSKLLVHRQLIEFLFLNQAETARIPFKDVIDTRSNLNAEVLREVFFTLGLSVDPDVTAKELLIDGCLVASRHAVAHGRRRDVDQGTYDEVRTLVFFLLDYIKMKVENAAVAGSYRRTRPHA